jgi:GTP1/Obg family GTP-binding protein
MALPLPIDPTALLFAVSIFSATILSILLVSRRIDKAIVAIERRVESMEFRLQQVPPAESLHAFHVRFAEVCGDIKRLNEQHGAMSHTLRRIEDHLLSETRKGGSHDGL